MSDPADKTTSKGMPLHTKIVIGLTIGAILGVCVNALSGSLLKPEPAPERTPLAAVVKDQPATNDAAAPKAAKPPTPPRTFFSDLNDNKIADGIDFLVDDVADFVGKFFLRLILMVVIPLVFSALCLGVYGIGDVRKLGRVGLMTLLLTAVLSASAVFIGVGIVNVLKPGKWLTVEQRQQLQKQYSDQVKGSGKDTVADAKKKAAEAKSIKQILLDMLPENPVQEMAGALDGSSKGNGMLAVMFFSLSVGIALTTLSPDKSKPFADLMEAVFEICMAIIAFAMRIAPYAVACMMFALTSRLGLDVLKPLLGFAGAVIGGIAFQLFVVYSLLIWFVAGRSPLKFFSDIREAMLTAFATSSSNATLPTALKVAEENLGLRKQISTFVLTIGATGNQNGTALFEGVVVLFLAQVFDISLTFGQQISVVLMSILAGVGTAGVPGGSIPMIIIVLGSVGVPAEGIGLILGIDRILDMCRTVLNVTGDITLATCVDALEPKEIVDSKSATHEGGTTGS